MINRIRDATEGVDKMSQEELETKMKCYMAILDIVLKFSNNLLKDSGSRSIYNSVDVSDLFILWYECRDW